MSLSQTSAPPAEPSSAPRVAEVNGVRVVRQEPVNTNLPVRDGRTPAVYRGFERLVLEDGTESFVCTAADDCQFVGTTRGDVQRHKAMKHPLPTQGISGSQKKPPKATVSTEALAMTIGDVVEMATNLQTYANHLELTKAERDEWRQRAMDAERELREIRAGLSRLGYVMKDED